MLPQLYEPAAALLLFISGVLACLAGYRLFKFVLGVYGFILGAAIASSTMGVTNTTGMIVAAIVGGLAGAVILVLAYFVGVALVGASLGVLVAHVAWNYTRLAEPPLTVIVLFAVLGAMGAMLLQRYVIIVATAFGGAWTAIIGGVTMGGDRRFSSAAASGDVWILYPMTPSPGNRWMPIAWLVLGLVGTVVQLGITGRRTRR